ncbi:ArsR family transcriptional regulator [Saccharopolyspora erythraea NRRL 2338]|uniref:Transcriptional regulator, ArsR family n=1 Tax=Saccharopolyspora erythraea (strain ATCC 11635 / DSM 40517 / JCM 4748 / NBRC 13426 / NCIMB 8594 / NRRL 2338) TaxID=405948 RepID=A4F5W4_SACEN|nr:ArsR family transcriptional regulator [Saccharopolyspora erythraea D]PFG93237.1 ArsR family transcriptional regulator [Saccharopolyspora erythraea NRRL 2338]QRK90090.1 winged helix-turn-helix transcriptional regulator [Saccharopolyspora erythraea]CAL99438.1 transcriptional regulator, ArsR family [Saccharopolyspora erythraea NRRL 2338]
MGVGERRGGPGLGAGGDADFTTPAELIGNPARSAMLLALLDGRALPMSMLASEAGVAPSTASAHLSRLVSGGLLRVRGQGRHRYYELASAEVVAALEALARLAPPRPVRSLRAGTRAHALRLARTCYDHVAGHLGVALMQALLEAGAVVGGDGRHDPRVARLDRLSAPGRDLDYRLTDAGWELFSRLGVVVPSGRRRLTAYCVDWTEQRHHLAGAAGSALLTRFEELDWVRRGAKGAPRALGVTDAGRLGFAEHFAIDTEALAA